MGFICCFVKKNWNVYGVGFGLDAFAREKFVTDE